MAKQLVNSFVANRIYWANVNQDGMMSEKGRKDVTEDAVKAVFQHMKGELIKRKGKGAKDITFIIDGYGSLTFTTDEGDNT